MFTYTGWVSYIAPQIQKVPSSSYQNDLRLTRLSSRWILFFWAFWFWWWNFRLPSDGNPPFPLGNTSSNGGFSIVMLAYWRVTTNWWFGDLGSPRIPKPPGPKSPIYHLVEILELYTNVPKKALPTWQPEFQQVFITWLFEAAKCGSSHMASCVKYILRSCPEHVWMQTIWDIAHPSAVASNVIN